ncbi:hypothetical protein GCM10008090_29780 [Arenicella chitinivorans]|uniref:Uncharacterized protein n=1 Tax=Arenicella chitinivorans TaxID=1329800 RepID=A0A918VSA6_9GAMM|nr:hypothetical protein [Arenicella chitinivorans]GHA18245.1 hypothetical protein GCM10008090_29780 [Arenicella chitinivorans]
MTVMRPTTNVDSKGVYRTHWPPAVRTKTGCSTKLMLVEPHNLSSAEQTLELNGARSPDQLGQQNLLPAHPLPEGFWVALTSAARKLA